MLHNSSILRSGLDGKDLNNLLINPAYTMSLDVGEMNLFVLTSLEGDINVYNYDGEVLRQLKPPCSPSVFVVVNNNIYMRPALGTHHKCGLNHIYKVPINGRHSTLEISDTYPLFNLVSINYISSH